MLVALLLKTLELLKFVVVPMLPICDRMFCYSCFAELTWPLVSVPFADSVARVTARSSRLVTWESAPSAVCNRPMPEVAKCEDWARAASLACRPSDKARTAASSATELLRDTAEGCCTVLYRL